MSEMKLEQVVRFKILDDVSNWSMDDKHLLCYELLIREADEKDEGLGEFLYERNPQEFVPSFPDDGAMYIDFIISEERDAGDVNISMPIFTGKDSVNSILFKFNEQILPRIRENLDEDFARDGQTDANIRVLYYYNGGCAGLREVA